MTQHTVRELRYFAIAMSIIRSHFNKDTEKKYIVMGCHRNWDFGDDASFVLREALHEGVMIPNHYDVQSYIDIDALTLNNVYSYEDCVQVKINTTVVNRDGNTWTPFTAFNVWIDRSMLVRLYDEVGMDGVDDEPQDKYADWDFSQTKTLRGIRGYDNDEDEDVAIDITYPYVLLTEAGTPRENVIAMINRHIEGIKELPSFGKQEHLEAIEKLTNFMDEM